MQDILFVLFAAWTLGTAAMVVCCRRPVYAALGLGLSALGTAALCALAAAPFLAAAQALVYGGTAGLICATLFAALAIRIEAGHRGVYGVAGLGVALFGLLARYLIAYRPSGETESLPVAPGDLLFGEYALALYMVTALLLAAVIAISVLIRSPQTAEGQ